MTNRPPLTPVPYARRTEPTKSLAQGAEYVPAVSSDIRALFARIQYPQEQQTCATTGKRS